MTVPRVSALTRVNCTAVFASHFDLLRKGNNSKIIRELIPRRQVPEAFQRAS